MKLVAAGGCVEPGNRPSDFIPSGLPSVVLLTDVFSSSVNHVRQMTLVTALLLVVFPHAV